MYKQYIKKTRQKFNVIYIFIPKNITIVFSGNRKCQFPKLQQSNIPITKNKAKMNANPLKFRGNKVIILRKV